MIELNELEIETIEKYCDQYHDRKSESLPWNSMFQLLAYNFMFAQKMSGKSIDINHFIQGLRKPMKTLLQNLTN